MTKTFLKTTTSLEVVGKNKVKLKYKTVTADGRRRLKCSETLTLLWKRLGTLLNFRLCQINVSIVKSHIK